MDFPKFPIPWASRVCLCANVQLDEAGIGKKEKLEFEKCFLLFSSPPAFPAVSQNSVP